MALESGVGAFFGWIGVGIKKLKIILKNNLKIVEYTKL